MMLNPRPAVMWFARRMEDVLRRNDYKGTWAESTVEALLWKLHEEVAELHLAVLRGADTGTVVKEAVDVGNMAMMIADVAYQDMKQAQYNGEQESWAKNEWQ